MESCRHPQFLKMFEELPDDIQALAREAFQKWKKDPSQVDWHRILECKKANVFSAKITLVHRAVGIITQGPDKQDRCCWVFIGRHPAYDQWIVNQKARAAITWTRDESVQRMFAKMDANPAVPVAPAPSLTNESTRSPHRRRNR